MEIKGYLHSHSDCSYDGKNTLAEIKEAFSGAGASFLALTEHTDNLASEAAEQLIVDCRRLSDDKFLLIPGFEVPYQTTHILIVGAVKYYQDENLVSLLGKYKADGAIIILAHPQRNHYFIGPEIASLLDGCEIWNVQYDGKSAPRRKSMALLESVRQKHESINAFAGLDFHRLPIFGGPAIQLEVEALDRQQLLKKLKDGLFIIDNGEVRIDPNGRILNGNSMKLFFASFLSIALIRFFKIVSSILFRLKLGPPRSIKEKLRKIL